MNKFWHDIKILTVVIFLMVSSVAITLWIVRETQGFTSLPSGVGAEVSHAAPTFLLSTIDLQRILNVLYPDLKLKEDGVYGPATKAAHERAIGDQYAKELMVKEIR